MAYMTISPLKEPFKGNREGLFAPAKKETSYLAEADVNGDDSLGMTDVIKLLEPLVYVAVREFKLGDHNREIYIYIYGK